MVTTKYKISGSDINVLDSLDSSGPDTSVWTQQNGVKYGAGCSEASVGASVPMGQVSFLLIAAYIIIGTDGTRYENPLSTYISPTLSPTTKVRQPCCAQIVPSRVICTNCRNWSHNIFFVHLSSRHWWYQCRPNQTFLDCRDWILPICCHDCVISSSFWPQFHLFIYLLS